MPEISEELFAAFEATTFSDDEDSVESANAELMETDHDDESGPTDSVTQECDDDETLISDDERADACGHESDRSEDEEPTAEDMEFIDNSESSDNKISHQALLQAALANDEEEDNDDIMSE